MEFNSKFSNAPIKLKQRFLIIHSRDPVSNHHLYIRGEEIAQVDHCEYLGIAVDDRLSFKKQISKCSIRVNNRLFQLRKIRGCITTNCALSIYKTMILPLLEYGGVFLSSCTDAEQTKLQRLQNAALRTVYRQDNYARVYDLHIRANLLPLKLRREITLIKIMHTKVYNNEGICVRNLNTRNYDGPVMDICRPNSKRFSKSVAYRGPVSWNQLKPDLRCINDKYVLLKPSKVIFGNFICHTRLFEHVFISTGYNDHTMVHLSISLHFIFFHL